MALSADTGYKKQLLKRTYLAIVVCAATSPTQDTDAALADRA